MDDEAQMINGAQIKTPLFGFNFESDHKVCPECLWVRLSPLLQPGQPLDGIVIREGLGEEMNMMTSIPGLNSTFWFGVGPYCIMGYVVYPNWCRVDRLCSLFFFVFIGATTCLILDIMMFRFGDEPAISWFCGLSHHYVKESNSLPCLSTFCSVQEYHNSRGSLLNSKSFTSVSFSSNYSLLAAFI